MRSHLDGITCSCESPSDVTVSSKNSELSWTFKLSTKNSILHNVALLNDANRHHFCFVSIGVVAESAAGDVTKTYQLDSDNGKNNLQVRSPVKTVNFELV